MFLLFIPNSDPFSHLRFVGILIYPIISWKKVSMQHFRKNNRAHKLPLFKRIRSWIFHDRFTILKRIIAFTKDYFPPWWKPDRNFKSFCFKLMFWFKYSVKIKYTNILTKLLKSLYPYNRVYGHNLFCTDNISLQSVAVFK